MPETTEDPIAELCEVAASALEGLVSLGDDPADNLRPAVEAILEEAASQQWIAKQLSETGLKTMDFRNGMTMELQPAREMVAMWVGAARAMLGPAPNYTETTINGDPDDPDGDRPYGGGSVSMEVKVAESIERYAVILQRVGPGYLTPHEARLKAEAERDAAQALLRDVIALQDVTHKYRIQGGHDTLGAGLTCSGCQIADQIREHLAPGREGK